LPKKLLPEVMLDQERFPEIVTNLVGNALKFTPEKGTVTVSAILNKDMVEVSVTDNGVGISKEDLPKLFSKFGRLDNSYKAIATTGGTGLGLYITKNLAQLHGGQITVLSQIGKGTTFTFTLRVATEKEKKQKQYIPAPQGVIINPELMGQFKTTS
jgi:two-component system phosphate regulon sensor histidine kinase PhoR